jgi:hypothetical protein
MASGRYHEKRTCHHTSRAFVDGNGIHAAIDHRNRRADSGQRGSVVRACTFQLSCPLFAAAGEAQLSIAFDTNTFQLGCNVVYWFHPK